MTPPLPLDALLVEVRRMVARSRETFEAGRATQALLLARVADGALADRIEDMPLAERNDALYLRWKLKYLTGFVPVDPLPPGRRALAQRRWQANWDLAELWLDVLRAKRHQAIRRRGLSVVAGGRK